MSRLASIALLLCVPIVGFAQGPAFPGAPWANKLFLPDIGKNPNQVAPPVLVHDFGTVPHGTLCVHRFTVTNIYDVPMQVVDIRRSCGCLIAYPPEKVLQPNESAEFLVTMDTAKFKGPNAQTIYVTFGPKYISTAVLRIQGNSLTDVTLNPGAIHFGTVAQGANATQTAALDYHGRQRDWKVIGVVKPSGPLDVDVKQVSGGFAIGAKYQVSVSLKSNAPAGPLAEVITLKTNDPSAPIVQINVTGSIMAPLTLSTKRIQFGKIRVGDTVTHKVIVTPAGQTPFVIQPIPDAGDGVSVETFAAATPVHIVTVKVQATKAGMLRKELTLQTNLSGGATAVLVVEAEVEEKAP